MWLWGAALVAILATLYILYPEPELTPKLVEWKKGGSFIEYKGYQIFYRVEKGSQTTNRVLLCLHGFPTSSYDWIKILDGLKKEFSTVIMYDYIGFGFSDKPENHTYSIMEQADIGERILKTVGVSEVHLLSHDYGDTVALELLARYNNKENVDGVPKFVSLCLTNGGVFQETNFPRPAQKLLVNPYIGPLASRLSNFLFFSKGFGEVFGPNTQPSKDEFWDFYVQIAHKKGHRISYRLLQYLVERKTFNNRWIGALKKSIIPVHMIYGPSDPVNPDMFIDHYKKTVPQHSITVLDKDIGHYPQWEAPAQLLASYTTFIRSSS